MKNKTAKEIVKSFPTLQEGKYVSNNGHAILSTIKSLHPYPWEESDRESLNSLAGGFDYSLKLVNSKLISTINILSIFCEIAIRGMPQHLTDH